MVINQASVIKHAAKARGCESLARPLRQIAGRDITEKKTEFEQK